MVSDSMGCPQCKSPYLLVKGMKLTCSCGYEIDFSELLRENEELKKEIEELKKK